MRSDSVVIIPTYNEKENIENIIRAVFGLEQPFDMLIIDDGSPDGTATIVKRLMANEFKDRLHLIERTGKLGLGTAYIAGFKWAVAQKYDYVFEMDADFSHNPNDLPRLYAACAQEGYDVAIGSRYVNGVNVVNWPMGRILMSYYASKYVRIITGLKINDTTAGFKCYRRRVLETIITLLLLSWNKFSHSSFQPFNNLTTFNFKISNKKSISNYSISNLA